MNINEQLVLVTGGARGLGHSIVQTIAREGACVVINYHKSQEAAAELAQALGPKALAVQADITDEKQVKALFEHAKRHFGRPINSVVNNALADFAFNGDARKKLLICLGKTSTNNLKGRSRAL
jgi:3-oxoacyl-[acyl-carrier protein] reductase